MAVSTNFTRTANFTCYVNTLQRRVVHLNAPNIAQRLFIISYVLMLMLMSVRCCFINQTDHGHNQSYTLNLRSQHAIHTGLPSKGQATPPVYCGKERENRPYKMIVYLTSTLLKNGDIQPNPGPQLSAYTDGQLSPAVSPTSVVPAAAGMGDGCMTFGRRRKQTRGI